MSGGFRIVSDTLIIIALTSDIEFRIPFIEQKRDIYDRYGKDGLSGNGSSSFSRGSERYDPFFARGASAFHYHHFRDPFEVFREFFSGRHPSELFNDGKC